MTQRIDRRELMKLAWTYARQEHWSRRMPGGTLRGLFPAALRRAWKDMKRRTAQQAKLTTLAAQADAEALRRKIFHLDQKTRLGPAGHRELGEARRLLALVTSVQPHSSHTNLG